MSSELRQRNKQQKNTESDDASNLQQNAQVVDNEKKPSTIWNRIIFGAAMAIPFILLCIYGGIWGMIFLIFGIEVCMYYELTNVRYKEAKEKEIPHFRTLAWGLLFTTMFSVYGERLGTVFVSKYPFIDVIIQYHSFIYTVMYVGCFMLFVLSLKKGYYKYQIGQLAWSTLSIALIVIQAKTVFHNILEGKIWFFIPAALVILNDIWAYVGGRLFGRKIFNTNLIDVSPKKTWEGFYVGLIMTVICGLLIATYAATFPSLICPYDNYNCNVPDVFIYRYYKLLGFNMKFMPFHLHVIFLALFASICAPFGGFLASGIKRAYEVKDFGNVIPGHGGLMDRFDCQFIMAMYTTAHYKTFVKPLTMATVSSILAKIVSLSQEDQIILYNHFTEYLNNSGVFNQ